MTLATESIPLSSSKKGKNFLRIKSSFFTVFLFVLIGFYRFGLIDRGALSNPDEVRYWDAADAWEKLIGQRDIQGFFIAFSSAAHGRTEATDKPGDTTLRLIPSFLQGVLWKFSGGIQKRDPHSGMLSSGIHFRNPLSLRIPTAFNVIVSLLLLGVFYAVTLLLFNKDRKIAWMGTLVYGLLANSNIYIRHILPYDAALFIFLLSLYLILKQTTAGLPLSFKTLMAAGIFAGFGFTIYPGYYFFPLIIFLLIWWQSGSALFSKTRLLQCIVFGCSALSVLLFYEFLARLGKTSYLFYLGKHAERITQGSFEEGFAFLPKYLFEVESFAGVFILLGTIAYLFTRIACFRQKAFHEGNACDRSLQFLIFSGLIGFLYHATLSVSGKMVFYGRLLHMYFPFLIWGVLGFLYSIRRPLLKKILYFSLPFLSMVSFLRFASEYAHVAYPLSVLYELGIDTRSLDGENIVFESKPSFEFDSPPPRDFKTNEPYHSKGHYLLVNFGLFYPPITSQGYKAFEAPKNAKLIYQGAHFNVFPAYMYEAYAVQERRLAKERNYQVRVYELP